MFTQDRREVLNNRESAVEDLPDFAATIAHINDNLPQQHHPQKTETNDKSLKYVCHIQTNDDLMSRAKKNNDQIH